MSDSYYDVAVIGTELCGLITAAMLAKKNYRVLVVGHGHRPNTFGHDGFEFIRRPWLFSGFETSNPVKKVFAELSLSLEMHNRPKPYDPFYQVIMPGHRADVLSKERLFAGELNREFPGDYDSIMAFYRAVNEQNRILTQVMDAPVALPPQGFMESRAFRKHIGDAVDGITDPLRAFPKGHPFRPFALAPLAFSSHCHVDPYSRLQLIRAMTHLGRGLYHIEGGIDALKEIFIDKVKNNCGDYQEKASVERFVVKRGKAREMVLRDRRQVVGCDVVICNTDIKRFFKLIPEEDQKDRFHLKIHELQPTHVLYTVNFALRAEAIPEGMGHHAFIVDDPKKPLSGYNLVMLSLDPTQPSGQDVRVLSATVRLPVRAVRASLENVSHHDDIIIDRIKRVVHFFDEHLVAQASSCVRWDKRTRKSFVDPSQWFPIYGRPLNHTLESSAIAPRTAYKNILVTGDHLFGGLGFEGAFLGSLQTVRMTCDLVSRKPLLS